MLEIRLEPADRPPGSDLLAAFLDEITGLYGRLDPARSPSATPAELSPANGGAFLVGYADGRAVACAALKRLGPDVVEIKRMYVARDARGRGHARALLAGLEATARELGYRRVRLDTGNRQPEARALYESAGYRPIPDYNDNVYASYWYEKDLGDSGPRG